MVPLWKKYLSYVVEMPIENTSSPYNPHLEVSIKDGRLMLSTEKAIYSFADKYVNFGDVLSQLDYSQIENCLILGFGLGSIPFIVEKKLGQSLKYTGIEIDEEIIYLASKYVLPELTSEIELIRADAHFWIEASTDTYDLIAMDIFESDYIPPQFEEEFFLQCLKDMLDSDSGLLIYNRLAYTELDLHNSLRFFETVFKQVFPSSIYLKIKGNLMLLSRPI